MIRLIMIIAVSAADDTAAAAPVLTASRRSQASDSPLGAGAG